MGGLKSSMRVFMMMMMVATIIQSSNAQTRHVVGDALAWTIPSNGAAAYTTWASQQTFAVGDTLFFNFTTGLHNAAEVSQAAYGPCTTTNPISIATTGPATITLTTAGTHYYICTVGSHCQIGQKLTINVSAPAATPPPAVAPAIPATPATPAPAAAPTTPPPAATPTTTPTPAPVSPPAAAPTTTPAATPTTTPAAAPTTPPAATPTPAGATPPAPTTSGPAPASDTTPPPPSPSAAATAVVPATLLAFGLALFF